ncbi:hypothetical protein ACFQXB_04455 [Plastorhodobacter daqingensis]|uniref:Lipoprotein n=1 Tax=Plastorhodobacter daqingensis TaxID=1387281 RepID=A0ABW2UFK9_9RHOB
MRIVTLFVALAALAACQAPAPQPQFTGTPRERLIAAVEAAGCTISPSNSARIQQSSGLNEAQIRALAPELVQAGLVRVSGADSIQLMTENCR